MKMLIIGGSGFLGAELRRQTQGRGWKVDASYYSRPGVTHEGSWHQLDVRNRAQVEGLLATVAPRVVINVTSGGADWAVTADGSVHVAMATAKLGIRLVHVSSDAVFSGIGRTQYDETCAPDPITPYGAAKAAGETAVRLLCPDAAVVRTSLIIGDGDSEHERVVHELAAKEREGALFTDDIRCPIHVADLASGLWQLAVSNEAGVFHLAGADALSRYSLGVLIARRDGISPSLLPAGRRADTRLPGALDVRIDSHATQDRLGIRLRGAREFLGER
ncbi:SDR family oxidoreductase [Streptomyces microflavus]|uniref:SDR family oxidoreductase n=1 Tax=Streptomyces microflavus TaxID=1919 RepID=UPI002E35D9A4|nr:sugar nucleotide-binding protein [Streptomyces microflavus]